MDDQVKPRHATLGLIPFWGSHSSINSVFALVRTNGFAW